jgi:ATPase subunit of ABC transporter with duplicated ATPase domains
MTETLLQVDALETGYTSSIIGPISFRIDRGQIVGLAGPNGSGKSTLLKAIADDANIFRGQVVRREGLTVAWMEQEHLRMPEMPFTGWEYLRFTDATRHEPPPRLADWLDKRVDSLSGGQFQLLTCWMALGGAADLVLLDEPTNNLDEHSAHVLRDILARERGDRSILLVSHNPEFLEGLCDRVLELDT